MHRKVEPVLVEQGKHKTIQDLLNGRSMYIEDDWFEDWKFAMANSHPLVSLWTAHPLHPFSRGERRVVLFCQLSLAWTLNSFNLLFDRAPIFRFFYQNLFAPTLLYLWESYLRVMATCSCVQGEAVPVALRALVEKVGHAVIGGATLVSLILLLLGGELVRWRLSDADAKIYLTGWLWTMAISWVYAVIFDSALFWWTRRKELRRTVARRDVEKALVGIDGRESLKAESS